MLRVVETSAHPYDAGDIARLAFGVFECWRGSDHVFADAFQWWMVSRDANLLYSSKEGAPVADGEMVESHPWMGWSLVYRGHVAWVNIGCSSTREVISVAWRSILYAVAVIDMLADAG